jgi:SAM-dependent methyltransferase
VNDTPALPRMRTVDEVYGSAFAEKEAFEAALSESLAPRGFDLMFDLVADLGLPAGSTAMDVGAREAYHCIELSRRFGFTVHGIEPVRRHLDNAARALDLLAATEPEIAARIRMDQGTAERLGEPDGSIDLIWCRDVLEHVEDLEAVFGEFRRVMRPAATAVIYQMTATDWLTPAEAARLWPPAGIHAASVDPQHFEAAITASGLRIRQCIQLHGQWREHAEEDGAGLSSRQLLWVSRLLRNRPDYENRFGTDAYEAMLANSLWGIYQMIGKLNPRIYVLSRGVQATPETHSPNVTP